MAAPPNAAEARAQIELLLSRYVACIDAVRLEEWPNFFTADGLYRITTRENHDRGLPLSVMECIGRGMMKDRVTAYRRVNVYEPHTYRHQYSALRMEPRGDNRFHCESNFLVVRTMQQGDMSIFATGAYIDDIVFEADGPKLKERLVLCDSRRIDTLLVIPL